MIEGNESATVCDWMEAGEGLEGMLCVGETEVGMYGRGSILKKAVCDFPCV